MNTIPTSTPWEPDRVGSRALPHLAASEAVRLVRHPLIVAGSLISAGLAAAVLAGAPPNNVYEALTVLYSFVLGPLAFFTARLAASRDRRSRLSRVLDATPVRERTRTIALLIACCGPAALVAAMAGATVIAYRTADATPPRWPTIGVLLVQPVTVLGGGLLGVMTARWLPWPGAGLTVMAILVIWVQLAGYDTRHETARSLAPYRALSTTNATGTVIAYFPGSLTWHTLYLLGLCAMAAIGALLATPGRRRALYLTTALAIAVACAAGRIQLR
jgi:hypothetical protein